MESYQLNDFKERLGQWVASQGFWFQMRYSLSGTGMKGALTYQVIRMSVRLLIFALLLAVVGMVLLVKRTDSQGFRDSFKQGLSTALHAETVEARALKRTQGELSVGVLAVEGGEHTFFSALEARNVRGAMGLLDGVIGTWDPGTIAISRLEIDLRAGADTAESAQHIADAFFSRSKSVTIDRIEVAEAVVRWGYSPSTRGEIVGSRLRAQRQGNGWRLTFDGGKFSQNWLRGLDIGELEVSCTPDGLVFGKAELRKGSASVNFSKLKVLAGERPQLEGTVTIRNLDIGSLLPAAAEEFIEGRISGDFRVNGSTNSSEGIGYKGTVVLDGNDHISIRDRVHLLRALSVVDVYNNYRRIDFQEGSFTLDVRGGGMVVSDVDLKADELITMEGAMRVRLPTAKEQAEMMRQGEALGGAPMWDTDGSVAGALAIPEESDFSLQRAARETQAADSSELALASDSTLFEPLSVGLEARRLQQAETQRLSRMLRYEGMFRVTLLPDAFERAEGLKQLHPVDPVSNRIPLNVPIEGNLFELTLRQAERLYQEGKR